jgi:hypothetical protein
MAEPRVLDQAERERLLDNLPWFLNDSLSAVEKAWTERAIAESPWAAEMVEREHSLVQSIAAPEPASGDLGLHALMERVRVDPPSPANVAPAVGQRAPPRPTSPDTRWGGIAALLSFLAQPRIATAMAVVVVLQTGVIGWLVDDGARQDSRMRSTPVTEIRTLRVTIATGTTEAQLRAALQTAGARIVGGPNQLGEYWLASEMRSLDEVRASLQASGLVTSTEIDLAGPRGH